MNSFIFESMIGSILFVTIMWMVFDTFIKKGLKS